MMLLSIGDNINVMKILFLLNNDVSRQQRVGKEVETLIAAGYQVSVLTLPSDQGATYHSDTYEIRTIHLWTRGMPKNLLFWPLKFLEMTLRFLIVSRKMRPDIIHCVDRLPLLSAFLISRWLRINYIYDSQEIHSGVESSANRPKWFWLWLERFLAQRALLVLVTDHFRRDLTAEILHLDKSKIFILMNLPRIPDIDRATRTIQDDVPWRNGHLSIYAGSLIPNRHLEDIIGALVFLPSVYGIAFVGFVESDYMRELITLSERLGVQERFVILQPVKWSELPSYIATADCAFAFYEKNSLNNYYCSPSKLFDSLMAGVPVISSDNPLVVEVIQQHDAGVCIPEVTPRAIADAVLQLNANEDMNQMKKNISKVARIKFSWESQAQEFIKLYRRVEEVTIS